MVTRRVIDDEDIWDIIGRFVFPIGIPPLEGLVAETKFKGGYPDRFIEPMTLEWDHDFDDKAEKDWDRIIRKARKLSLRFDD